MEKKDELNTVIEANFRLFRHTQSKHAKVFCPNLPKVLKKFIPVWITLNITKIATQLNISKKVHKLERLIRAFRGWRFSGKKEISFFCFDQKT